MRAGEKADVEYEKYLAKMPFDFKARHEYFMRRFNVWDDAGMKSQDYGPVGERLHKLIQDLVGLVSAKPRLTSHSDAKAVLQFFGQVWQEVPFVAQEFHRGLRELNGLRADEL